ncbi:Tyrosine recombinase XerC [Pseudomonas fluorescens]|uniref:Tyrosine recombinase XerC n=1 Tax=Pseudomonas fluorescens TaxID=294 RepID=A0A5E7PS13_PSEFL|nr:Tyrosine recombinase XerC [Pseudomonas fluorescens]
MKRFRSDHTSAWKRFKARHAISIYRCTRGAERIHEYLERDNKREPSNGPLFRSIRGTTTITGAGAGVSTNGSYTIVAQWAKAAGIHVDGLGVHGLRATAATNALEHDTDIAKVQVCLGHANIVPLVCMTDVASGRRIHRPTK